MQTLRAIKQLGLLTLRRLLIVALSDYARARYGGWWAIREEGLKRIGTRWGGLLCQIFERQVEREGGWIGRGARFEGPPCFPHGMKGIFISNEARLGRRCVLFQHAMVVSSQLLDSDRRGAPHIGDDVYLSCGAVAVGPISIGDGCRLGTNVVVHHDLAPHSLAVTQPARIIKRERPMDNRHASIAPDGTIHVWEDGAWIRVTQK